MPYILSLDIGTSSVRASAYDLKGNPVDGAEARVEYRMNATADGGVEIDADRLAAITIEQIDCALSLFKDRNIELIAVAISAFWHSLLCIDSNDRPLTPLISWNDVRSRKVAAELRESINETELQARTGCRLHASYWPAKILWLSKTDPSRAARTRRFLSFGDYLMLKLFADAATSVSMASGTGIFNQRNCKWDESILQMFSIDIDRLPPIADLDQPMVNLRKEYADRWPSLAAIPWHLPIGDGACSNIGVGCADPSRFALMIGTSGAIRAVTSDDDISIPDGLWSYRIDRKRRILGGALSNGGDLFAWMRDTLRLPEGDALNRAVAQLEADGHGLTMLPMLSGERSPGWRDEATGAIAGLRLATRPEEILRAGLEAVAYQFALVYERLKSAFGEPREITATGGGLQNLPVWRQIIADALGTTVSLSGVAEASGRGAALLALEAMGLVQSEELLRAPVAETYSPDENNCERYKKALMRYQRIYKLFAAENTESTEKL